MGYRLGIDLGTAFTAAAFIEDTEPRMLELGRRQVSVPSVLFVTDDGTLLIGEAAERRAASEPDRVIREFKRRFGDEVPLVVAGHSYTPIELQTEVLRWVLDHAEQRLPPLREHAVITHPAAWGPYKLKCMREMLAEADISGALLCAEPVAAAIDFAATRKVPEGAKLAIYDLGGGTFDVAVLEKTPAGFTILGTPLGVDHLGGSDFDEALFAGTLERLDAHDLDQDDPDVARGLIALRRECVEAKEALSTDVNTQISSLLPGAVRTVQISRRELEDLIRPGLHQTVATTSRALRLAGIEASDLHCVVLVGGSSRIPLVTELLSRELGVPVVLDTYPKNTIALGAARHARFVGLSPDATTAGAASSPLAEPVRSSSPPPAVPSAPASSPLATPPRTSPPPAPLPLPPRPLLQPATSSPRSGQPPRPTPSTMSAAAGAAVTDASAAHDHVGGRRRPTWILPVGLTAALGLVITTVLLITNLSAPEPGVLASPTAANTDGTSTSPSATVSIPASPSIPTPPPTSRPVDPSLPIGPPISQDIAMVPMRTTENPDERRTLHLIDITGATRTVVITSDKGGFTNPTVQPGRTTILLRRDVQLWVMSSEGKRGRHLEHRNAGGCRSVVGVSWSPVDPDVLVIACQIGESNRQRLQVINTKGKLIRTLDAGKRRIGDDVTISPDGRKVLYWSTTAKRGDGGTLYTVNVDGSGKPKRITTGAKGRDGDPAWSPDGRQIAFRRLPTKKPTDSDVYVMNSDGTQQRKVADTEAEDMKPVWSPDGTRLLIVSNRRSAKGPAGKNWGLWLVGVEDGKIIRQVGGKAPEITTPTWLYR